jgi:hypothetical protein
MRIIIWGHKPFTHSHAFIHDGFEKAFKYLGYETYRMDNEDDVSNFDFTDCLFLTEGQCIEKIPKRKDCKYILHNCPPMEGIGDWVNIQYLTYDSWQFSEVSHGITFRDGCLYFPWGSPSLPEEFDLNDVDKPRSNIVYYLGSLYGKDVPNGNYKNVAAFANASYDDNHPFHAGGSYTGVEKNRHITYLPGWITEEDQTRYLKDAYMSPAIQGASQLVNGMIPCRIFKAISFGNDGITNNPMAYEFFKKSVVWDSDCYNLYFEAKNREDEIARKKWLMNFVKENHTYLNNIKAILQCL